MYNENWFQDRHPIYSTYVSDSVIQDWRSAQSVAALPVVTVKKSEEGRGKGLLRIDSKEITFIAFSSGMMQEVGKRLEYARLWKIESNAIITEMHIVERKWTVVAR